MGSSEGSVGTGLLGIMRTILLAVLVAAYLFLGPPASLAKSNFQLPLHQNRMP